MKKLYTILILFTFFISFANTTYADTNYHYQIIMGGELKEISWPTKTQCEADYATVLTEYKNTVVKGCYLGSKLPATPPVVIPPGTLYWFTNAQYQLQNFPDGYPTIDSCNTASAAFSKSAGMTIVKPCAAMTLDQATAQHATETLKPVDNAVPIGAKVGLAENKSVYTMLAPIGNITHMDSSGSDACKNDPTCIPNDIGTYLNIIFKLAIGICSALAVIMLIINGVKYMGDESVFGKTEAKKNMFGSIVGLLIALGAWALLNTINPALTGQNGLNISSASVSLNPDSPDYQRNSTSGSQGKVVLMDWPTKQLHDMALAVVQSSGLVGLQPTDATSWFQTATPTAENWVSLLAGMASGESSFIASQLTPEPLIKVDSSGKTAVSVGLLQLSVEDCVNYKQPACTQTDLQGPNFNIKLGVAILKKLVVKDNIIAGQNGSLWMGGARYWHVLRNK